MPENIQKLTPRGERQSWEEAFEAADRTSQRYQQLIEDFAEFVGDYRDFERFQVDSMVEYLKNLDDVSKHWQEIGEWISKNTETAETFTGSLSEIRDLFKSISDEVGGTRRKTLDQLNFVRQLSRLATDTASAMRQEGGLTEQSLRSLEKRRAKSREVYHSELIQLGLRREDLEDNDKAAQLQERYNNLLRKANAEYSELNAIRGIRRDNTRIKELQEEIKYYTLAGELLDRNNREAMRGYDDRLGRIREIFREQKKGAGPNGLRASSVDLASRLLNRAGLTEEAADLKRASGEFWTRRTEATLNKELAEKKATEGRKVSRQKIEQLQVEQGNLLGRDEILRKEIADREQQFGQFSFDRRAGRWRNVNTGEFENTSKVQQLQESILASQIEQEAIQREYEATSLRITGIKEDQKKLEDELVAANRVKEDVDSKRFNLAGRLKDSLKSQLTLANAGKVLSGAIIAGLVAGFLKVDELASNLRQRIGSWEISMAAVNSQFASAADWLQTAVELADNWHVNPITIFTSAEIGKMAEAKNLLGLSGEQAQNLGIYAKITGQSADQYRKSISQGFQEYNRVNRTAISHGAVLKETLQTSDAIKLSYGGQGDALAKAANAALELGMTMQQIEGVASNLINFESSIQAEMQAQLLTGQQLNLAKAREYALNNDLAGVATEIKKQGIDSVWWSRSNRIQQENMAKALGMTRDEMAKMLITQELQNGASAEMLAKNMQISEEELKAMSMADTWKKTVAELAQVFTPIVQLIRPIVEVVGVVASKLSAIIGWVSSLGGLLDRMNDKTSKTIQTWGKAIILLPVVGRAARAVFTGHIASVKEAHAATLSLFGLMRRAPSVMGHSPEVIRRARNINRIRQANLVGQNTAAATRSVSQTGGMVTSLGRNMGGLIRGAAAAAILAGALWVLGKAVQEFQKLSDWSGLAKAGVALVGLTAAVVGIGALMSTGFGAAALILGTGAIIGMAVAVGVLGDALQNIAAVSGSELQSIAGGIRSIAGAVGELAAKLTGLSVRKLNALGRTFKNLKGAGIQVMAPMNEAVGELETTGEPKGIQKENIEASVQDITIKQAQVQASAQRISIEQKTADLKKIEDKLDIIKRTIEYSRPDWDWLKFGQSMGRNIPWVTSNR